MIQSSKLHNGIRIITEWVPSAHSVSLGFWVRNGSRHEPASLSGISHFLEHMLFKGTLNRSSLDIARQIDSVGGVLNAFTSREYSCYYAKVLSHQLPFAVDLLSDILLNSVFDAQEMEKERRVILQEIDLVEDTPDDLVHDLFGQNFWAGHPVGKNVLGSFETIASISRAQMCAFMEERYTPERILICAAGNLRHEELVACIQKVFTANNAPQPADACALPETRGGLDIHLKDLEQVHFCLGVPALPQNHDRRFEAFILNAVLGGSMSSRLFQRVREEQGLAYSIYSFLSCHTDAGALVVYGGTSAENFEQVYRLIDAEFEDLCRTRLGDEELQSAREHLKGSLLLSLESSDNLMTRLANNEIYHGRQYSIPEIVAGFDAVTAEGVRDLAERIFRPSGRFVQIVGDIERPLVEGLLCS